MRRLALPALLAAAAAVAALLLTLLLTAPRQHPRTTSSALIIDTANGFAGAALPQARPAPAFTLRDQAGRPIGPHSFAGQVSVLAFLDSSCAAPCVLIAQQIRGALDELAHPPPVVIVSADPAADTPPHIRRFLAEVSLAGRVHYLTGPPGMLHTIWHAYRVVPASAGDAAFARAATVRLLDGHGRERVLFGSEELTPEGLAHDIRKLSE